MKKSFGIILGTFVIVLMIFGNFVYTLNSDGDRDHIRVVYNEDVLESPVFNLNEGVWVSDGRYPGAPQGKVFWSG